MRVNKCMKHSPVGLLLLNKKAKSTSESFIFVFLEAVIPDNVLHSLNSA